LVDTARIGCPNSLEALIKRGRIPFLRGIKILSMEPLRPCDKFVDVFTRAARLFSVSGALICQDLLVPPLLITRFIPVC